MFIPKRRSSLCNEIDIAVEEYDQEDSAIQEGKDKNSMNHTIVEQERGCFLCTKQGNLGQSIVTRGRRRSSNSFKIGSFVDSLLIDRTSSGKSEPIQFTLTMLVTDFTHHQKRGGTIPDKPKRVNMKFPVQYVEWQDESNSPLVGNIDISEALHSKFRKFPGFLIPYKSTLRVSVLNTENSTIAMCLLEYDLLTLPVNSKRQVRYTSDGIVVQISFVRLNNKKYYVTDSLRIVILSKEKEIIQNNWEIFTVSQIKFDESYYSLCEKCQVN